MSIEHATQRLAERVASPRGQLTFVPWHGDERDEIRVWCETTGAASLQALPSSFEGYPVIVEPRPNFRAS